MPNAKSDPKNSRPSMLEAAVALARRSWHVFPVWWPIVTAEGQVACACPKPECRVGGERERDVAKHPVVYSGQNESTCDEAQVRRWWAEWPLANVGVALEPSGLMALDVDDRNGRDAAIAKLGAAQDALCPLPATVEAVTGSGCAHLYYRRPAHPIRGDVMGITVRGRNYVVAPPSLHRSGNRYAWEPGCSPDDVEVAELPDAWAEALRQPERDLSDVGAPADEPTWLAAIPQEERARRMREYVAAQRGERMGVDRSSLAFIVAAHAVRGYAVRDAEVALAAMLEYGARCEPPYPDGEIRERVWSAYEQAHSPAWGELIERELLAESLRRKPTRLATKPHPTDEQIALVIERAYARYRTNG
jgi:hypothetical protein